MTDWVALGISTIALLISGWTLWATLLKSGTVKMTRPTTIFFGPDNSPNDLSAKVYLRFLLYSTSRRGRVVESLFVRVKSSETVQSFPVWVYGNKDLSRGSGIFVGPEGVAANHHFLLPKSKKEHLFAAGKNNIEIVAKLVGDRHDIKLGEYLVTVSEEQARRLSGENVGLYFDWGGDHKDYVGWIDDRPDMGKLPIDSVKMLEVLAGKMEGAKK